MCHFPMLHSAAKKLSEKGYSNMRDGKKLIMGLSDAGMPNTSCRRIIIRTRIKNGVGATELVYHKIAQINALRPRLDWKGHCSRLWCCRTFLLTRDEHGIAHNIISELFASAGINILWYVIPHDLIGSDVVNPLCSIVRWQDIFAYTAVAPALHSKAAIRSVQQLYRPFGGGL